MSDTQAELDRIELSRQMQRIKLDDKLTIMIQREYRMESFTVSGHNLFAMLPEQEVAFMLDVVLSRLERFFNNGKES